MNPNIDQDVPAFGKRIEGPAYALRPGGYAVIADAAGRIAIVRVRGKLFLPGGGADPGETPEEAARREVREECGLEVADLTLLGTADEFLYAESEQTYFQKRCTFFATTVRGRRDATAAQEDDHELLWLDPEEAEHTLTHASQQWALTTYRSQATRT